MLLETVSIENIADGPKKLFEVVSMAGEEECCWRVSVRIEEEE